MRERAVTNVVMMGMGEPLREFRQRGDGARSDAGRQCLRPFKAPRHGEHFGAGACMDRLRERCPVALAVSLHAPNDALRDQLVPINKKYPIKELLGGLRALS